MNLSLMTVFEPILNAADNVIRQAANKRNLSDASELMVGLTEAEAFENLPNACFDLARLSEERRQNLIGEINALQDSDLFEAIKLQHLGRVLLRIVGKEVLSSLVAALKLAKSKKEVPTPAEAKAAEPAE